MLKRRALALLCALFFILSNLSLPAFAVDTLDDLGIDPWGDLGIIQQTPEPEIPPEISEPVQMSPIELEPAGEGGISVMSLITDDHSYITSYTGDFIQYFTKSAKLSYSWSNPAYSLPSQIGSGDENMFGSTYFVTCTSTDTSGTTNLYFKFADCKLNGSIDVPDNATSISFNGSISFYYITANAESAPVTVSGTPNLNMYQGCSISILGSNYSGIYDSGAKCFNFDTGEIDLSSFDGSSLDFSILFSQSQQRSVVCPRVTSGSITRYYGIRFMFTDGVSATFSVPESSGGFDEESKGLLRTIVDGIKNVVSGIGNIFTAIVELPGKMATAILDGLKGLFVPSQDDVEDLKDQYQTLLSERLGFIWQAGEWITSFGSDLLSALTGGSEAEFVFPGVGFDMNGEYYQLIEQQTVDFGENGIVTVVRPFVGTIVAFVVVAACVNLFHDMVGALISGKSYFDFLKGGGGA